MKICFVSDLKGWPWGGSEELWSRTARLALERGHRVALVTYRWPEIHPRIRDLQGRGARSFWMDQAEYWISYRLPLGRLKLAYERYVYPWGFIARWNPDLVCISQGSTFSQFECRSLVRFVTEVGVPYVVISQQNREDVGLNNEAQRHEAIAYLRRARRVAFVAKHNLRVAERQLAADLPNACVVRNPVNLLDFEPVPWPRSDLVKMAHVARSEARVKGQDVLLQVLGEGDWQRRHWLLRFYGAGPDRPFLERLATKCGIADRIEFCGHVGDIRSIWAHNHLLVLPSRFEGTPLSLVEAMICGRPSVVTDVGGNLEWIDEPSTGFIAEAPSPRALGNALERAWTAQESWEEMGQTAHQVALSKIDPNPAETLLSLLIDDRVACESRTLANSASTVRSR